MSASFVFCFLFLLAFTEAFFIPVSLRKQAPQATTYNNPQWAPSQGQGTSNGGVNTIPNGYGNPKDYNPYSQQQQQQPQSQQQLQSQQLQPQSQQYYPSQVHNTQGSAPKYEGSPYLPHYAYESAGYQSPVNSYSQSVQLVPCLCPVNKEMIEQQQQQQQQHQQIQQLQGQQPNSLSVSPTVSSFTTDTSGPSPSQVTQKKTT